MEQSSLWKRSRPSRRHPTAAASIISRHRVSLSPRSNRHRQSAMAKTLWTIILLTGTVLILFQLYYYSEGSSNSHAIYWYLPSASSSRELSSSFRSSFSWTTSSQSHPTTTTATAIHATSNSDTSTVSYASVASWYKGPSLGPIPPILQDEQAEAETTDSFNSTTFDNSQARSASNFIYTDSYSRNSSYFQDGNANTTATESSSIAFQQLPLWMTQYFDWHRQTRASLSPTNYHQQKYLILRCLREFDPKCGGASDRLQLLPLAVLLAYQSQRLLLIQWTRPHALDEYLVPSSINWTVPEWMTVPYQKVTMLNTKHAVEQLLNPSHAYWNRTFCDMRHQSNDYGQHYYDEYAALQQDGSNGNGSEPTFAEVYRSVWESVFVPAPNVRARILEQLSKLQPPPARPEMGAAEAETEKDQTTQPVHQQITPPQQPTDYISLHIRTLYARNASAHGAIIRNAVHCAYEMAWNESMLITTATTATDGHHSQSRHQQQLPKATAVWIATDSWASTQLAAKYARQFFSQVHGRIGSDIGDDSSTTQPHHPLHLDRGMDFLNSRNQHDTADAYWHHHPPSAFYDIFEDLYLLAGGRCHVYGLGGFGRWAAALSSNRSCVYNHAVKQRQCPVPNMVVRQSTSLLRATKHAAAQS